MRLRSGNNYQQVLQHPPPVQQQQLPPPDLPDEMWMLIARERMLPHYDTQQIFDFPQLEPFESHLLHVNSHSRGGALDVIRKELVVIELEFVSCEGHRALFWNHFRGVQINSYLDDKFLDEPFASWFLGQVSQPQFSLNRQDFSTVEITMDCRCDYLVPRTVRHSTRFRAHKLASVLMLYVMQVMIDHYTRRPDIHIGLNVRPGNGPKAVVNELLVDMRETIFGVRRVTWHLNGIAPQATIQSLNQRMIRRLGAGPLGLSLEHYTISLLQLLREQSIPQHYLLLAGFSIFAHFYGAIRLFLAIANYAQNNMNHRRVAATNANLLAFVSSSLSQYLLASPNDRESQRHFSMTRVNTEPHFVPLDPYLWDRIFDALDTGTTIYSAAAAANQPDARLNNLEYWTAIYQATAELRIAFARAAFVVGDDDALIRRRGPQNDNDPMRDVRENTWRTNKLPQAWETRQTAATRHLLNAQRDIQWIQTNKTAFLPPGIPANATTQRIDRWLARIQPHLDRLQAAINILIANAAEDVHRATAAARRHQATLANVRYRTRSGRWKIRRPRPRRNIPKRDANARLRAPWVNVRNAADLEFLIDVSTGLYTGPNHIHYLPAY